MNYALLLQGQTTINCHNFEMSLVRQALHISTTMFVMLWVCEALHCPLNLSQNCHVDTQLGWAANRLATTQASQPPSEVVHLPHCQPNPTSQPPNCLSVLAFSLPASQQWGPVTQFSARAGLNWPQFAGRQRWRLPAEECVWVEVWRWEEGELIRWQAWLLSLGFGYGTGLENVLKILWSFSQMYFKCHINVRIFRHCS